MLAYLPDGVFHLGIGAMGASWVFTGVVTVWLAPGLKRSGKRGTSHPRLNGTVGILLGVVGILVGLFARLDQSGCTTCTTKPWDGAVAFIPFGVGLVGITIYNIVRTVRESRTTPDTTRPSWPLRRHPIIAPWTPTLPG